MPKASGSKGGKSAANSRITSKIEAMAWNGDFTQVAIGVDKSIVVYSAPKADKKAWSKTAEMENAHGLDISGESPPNPLPRPRCCSCQASS